MGTISYEATPRITAPPRQRIDRGSLLPCRCRIARAIGWLSGRGHPIINWIAHNLVFDHECPPTLRHACVIAPRSSESTAPPAPRTRTTRCISTAPCQFRPTSRATCKGRGGSGRTRAWSTRQTRVCPEELAALVGHPRSTNRAPCLGAAEISENVTEWASSSTRGGPPRRPPTP